MNISRRYQFLILITLTTVIPLILNYFSLIFFDLGQYGNYITGVSALFAVVLTIIEFQFYKKNKVDDRIIRALIVARKFIYSLQYLTSPFSYGGEQKENEPYSDRLIRERNERMEVVKDDFTEFITISRDADLYLSNEELEILETLHDIWLKTKVGFNMHVMYLSQGLTATEENRKAHADAFIHGELNEKLKSSLAKLNDLIKNLNDRYKQLT